MKFHNHDCDCCKHLGSEQKDDNAYDYYVCEQQGMPTVIARFGSDGDYFSGLLFVKSVANTYRKDHATTSLGQAVQELVQVDEKDNPLFIATSKALKQGFLNDNLDYVSLPKKMKMK